MEKYKEFALIIKKFSIGLVPLLIFSIIITSSYVYAETKPLENDFTLFWGSPNDEEVYAMEFITDEIVYVAGDIGNWSTGPAGYFQTTVGFFLTKLNVSKLRSGNSFPDWLFSWERTDAIGIFGDMIIDSLGNIYVAGTVDKGGDNRDIFLMRFNDAGTLEWNITWATNGDESTSGVPGYWASGYSEDHPDGKCLIMDSANNVYIAGKSGMDIVLIKYNNLGIYQWNRTWNIYDPYGVPSNDYCEDIKIDSNDNIYIAIASDDRFFGVLKCNTEGIIQWNTTFGIDLSIDPPFRTDPPANILINSDGLFYYSTDYLTKFDLSTGIHLWNNSINTSFICKMDYDSMGNLVILTGISTDYHLYPGAGTYQLTTFTSDGLVKVNSTDLYAKNPLDFCIDSDDNIYTLSHVENDKAAVNILKINSNGERQYTFYWGSPEIENHDDYASKIYIDSSDNIYVSGKTSGFGSEGDFNIFFTSFSPMTPTDSAFPFELIVIIISTIIGAGAVIIVITLFIRRRQKLT